MKIFRLLVLILVCFLPELMFSQPFWITADSPNVNDPNTWIAFRKDVAFDKAPSKAVACVAADTKYWLWINGDLVVFEGGLKRGPSPHDTYYDEIDLSSYFKKGVNRIGILLWHFGKDGFSHKNSGAAGLIFKMCTDQRDVVSDSTWMSMIHPAYETAVNPEPNWRLPESNIRFVSEKDIKGWQIANDCESYGFKPSVKLGEWGAAPWHGLVKRPIPFWRDYGIVDIPFEKTINDTEVVYVAKLPYNMQMTPILGLSDSRGNTCIYIETDHLHGGSETNLRAEYITSQGLQIYESLGWLNGENIIIRHSKDAGVTVNSIGYRETGYDTIAEGSFICDDEFYNRFWSKALRTLYVNMRDTYFDCPDRERAQWWGDAVVLMGESFYTYSQSTHSLMRKAICELVNWQKDDDILFSPVPSGNYSDELPAQMLTSIGYYGFWTYYMNTGDSTILPIIYPAIKRYLKVWSLDDIGLTQYRSGGWSWGDWGDNIDIRLLLAGWHYLALKSGADIADLLGFQEDAVCYRECMRKIKEAYNKCWNGFAYRHPQYHAATDDRVQALAVLSGIAGPEKYDKILQALKTQWYASPYMEKYVMEALFIMNQGEYALERVKSRFANMVNDIEHTTLFEDWSKGGAGGGSTNHAWSGGPITVIGQNLCGIAPLEPGYSVFKIEPQLASFNNVSISVPSVAGVIESSFIKDDRALMLSFSVPDGSECVVYIADSINMKHFVLEGKSISKYILKSDSKYIKEGKQCFGFPAGKYRLKIGMND